MRSNNTPKHVPSPVTMGQLLFLTRVERKDGHWFYPHSNSITWAGQRISPLRAVWAAYHDYVPSGTEVRNTCGVTGCINPEHLRLSKPYPSRICPNCGGRKWRTSTSCAYCAGLRERPVDLPQPKIARRRKRTSTGKYGTICPECGGDKAPGAMMCRNCRFPSPRHPSTGTVCPDCGGEKTPQSARCMNCYLASLGSERGKSGTRHGTEGNYNRGCRCPDCTTASTKARRARRARREKTIAVSDG